MYKKIDRKGSGEHAPLSLIQSSNEDPTYESTGWQSMADPSSERGERIPAAAATVAAAALSAVNRRPTSRSRSVSIPPRVDAENLSC